MDGLFYSEQRTYRAKGMLRMSASKVASQTDIVPTTQPIPAGQKTDIIMAMREVARGMEQGHPDILSLMQMLGTELLVFALKYGPALERIGPEETERLVRREIAAIAHTVAKLHEHQTTEAQIINDRLMRMFDPTLAFNEAINRAITAKQAEKGNVDEERRALDHVNGQAWALQIRSVLNALRAA